MPGTHISSVVYWLSIDGLSVSLLSRALHNLVSVFYVIYSLRLGDPRSYYHGLLVCYGSDKWNLRFEHNLFYFLVVFVERFFFVCFHNVKRLRCCFGWRSAMSCEEESTELFFTTLTTSSNDSESECRHSTPIHLHEKEKKIINIEMSRRRCQFDDGCLIDRRWTQMDRHSVIGDKFL